MFQLPPIPDVAARLNQMRQSATLAPIQQAQQQRGQVFQPSLPRGGGNGLAQGAAGLGEGLKTVAAVLKERQEEEKAKGFVDNFFNQFDPQSQTMPPSFPDGPTGDTAQQVVANKQNETNPFFTEAGWKTARAMKDAGQYVPLMGILQTRMMQPPKEPETFDLGPDQVRFRMGPDGTTVKIAEGPAKSTAPTSDRGKLRKEFQLGEYTVEEYEAKLADLNKEGKPLTLEDLKNFGYRPGTVAYWKGGVPVVGQAPEATKAQGSFGSGMLGRATDSYMRLSLIPPDKRTPEQSAEIAGAAWLMMQPRTEINALGQPVTYQPTGLPQIPAAGGQTSGVPAAVGAPPGSSSAAPVGRVPPDVQARVDDLKTTVRNSENALTDLQRAMQLSETAYSGQTAEAARSGARLLGLDKQGVSDTTEMEQLILQTVLPNLRAIFGGSPAEGERKVLMDMNASVSMSREERKRLLANAMTMIQRKRDAADTDLKSTIQGNPLASPTQVEQTTSASVEDIGKADLRGLLGMDVTKMTKEQLDVYIERLDKLRAPEGP